MRRLNKLVLRVILFAAIFLNIDFLYAQTAPTISVVPEIATGLKTEIVDNKLYTLTGSNLVYKVKVDGEGTLENGIWTLYLNGVQKNTGTTNADISITDVEQGEYQLTYKACRAWVVNEKTVRDTVDIENITSVVVYATPVVNNVSATQIDTYHNKEFTFEAAAEGGDPDGWTYEWTHGGETLQGQTDKKITLKIANTTGAKIAGLYRLTAVNKCNGVEFMRKTIDFYTTVYSQVSVTKLIDNVTVNNKQEFTLSANVSGGYSEGFTYQWYKGSELIGEGLTLTRTEDNKEEGMQAYKYTLRTINKFGNETWATVDTEFTANVSGISISQKNSNTFELDGYSGKPFKLSAVVECAKPQTLVYEWKNGNEVIGDAAEIEYTVDNNYNAVVSHDFTLTVKNVKSGKEIDSATETFTVRVYPKGKVEYTTANDTIICGNASTDFGIKVSGGYPGGWEYQWYRDNAEVSGATQTRFQYGEMNSGTTFVQHTYKVIAKNIYKGEVWDTQELTFNARVYPDVRVQDIIPQGSVKGFYMNGTYEMGAIFTGGYDAEGAWQFQWLENGSPIGGATTSVYTHDRENNSTATESYVYTLIASNMLNGKVIYTKNINYTVNVYSQINAQYVSGKDSVISGGHQVDFKLKTTGGYNEGWTYQWYRNDVLLSGYTKSSILYDEINNSTNSECLSHVYKVVAINSYEGAEFDRLEREFNIKVYPQITSPSCTADMLETKKFREDRYIEVGSNPGLGGYTWGWEYKWYDNATGNKLNEQEYNMLRYYKNLGTYSDSAKAIRNKEFRMEYKNVSPEGVVLDKGSFTFNVKIYRCPMKPIDLIQKGTASNIFIADMMGYITSPYMRKIGLNDSELERYEYKFLFGYGEDEELPTLDRSLRYAKYTPEQAAQRPWVRTYWVYDDGFTTSSEKFHLGDTRGDLTNIENVVETGEIKIDGSKFTATLAIPEPAIVTIYSINGLPVRKVEFEAAQEYNESIDTNDIESGIYLIEVRIGKKREIRKLVVE